MKAFAFLHAARLTYLAVASALTAQGSKGIPGHDLCEGDGVRPPALMDWMC